MNKKYFTEQLKSILKKLDFSQEIKIEAIDHISKEYIIISKMSQEVMKDWDNYLINMKNPYNSLMILIYKIVELDELYKSKKIPQDIMIDTLSDLILRQQIYYEEHGELGLTEEDMCWLKHIYYLNIFKLGSLQYELATMSYKHWPKDKDLSEIKQRLPEGSKILRVHIRRGVNLSKDHVDESFDFSKKFFKTYYPDYDYVAYTCSSWMLYSKNSELFSSDSNILNFASRFEVICETMRRDMSIKYIFGKEYENIEDYPKQTSLQRKVLKNFNNLGVGYGVIYVQ